MLAQRIDVDFFDDDHVLAIFVEDGVTDNITNSLFVAFGEENQGLKRETMCRSFLIAITRFPCSLNSLSVLV